MSDKPAPDPANWTCTIGEVPRDLLGDGKDGPMRDAVNLTFRELFGFAPHFTFSGWGNPLPEIERAAHEDRMPDPKVSLEEMRERREMLIDEIGRHRPDSIDDLSALDRIDWIQRNVGKGAPGSWMVNDFVALATVKLGIAVVELNPQEEGGEVTDKEKASGRLELLAAAMICIDAAERYT